MFGILIDLIKTGYAAIKKEFRFGIPLEIIKVSLQISAQSASVHLSKFPLKNLWKLLKFTGYCGNAKDNILYLLFLSILNISSKS